MRTPSLSHAMQASQARRRALYVTAAAALGSTLSSSCHAFAPIPSTRYAATWTTARTVPLIERPSYPVPAARLFHTRTRLYSSKKDSGGFLDKVKDVAKSILPTRWFEPKDEKKERMAIERNRVRKDVKGGIQQLLKDAPLPVRIIGSMIAPLMSSLAESIGEQQQQMEELLEDARMYLVRDPATAAALGEPLTVQPPFSQSSSTISVNGKSTSQIQASFYVQGAYQTGVATMNASQDGISALSLKVGGRTMLVNLSTTGPSTTGSTYTSSQSYLGKNPKNKGDIIDVEFVEKDKDTK